MQSTQVKFSVGKARVFLIKLPPRINFQNKNIVLKVNRQPADDIHEDEGPARLQ